MLALRSARCRILQRVQLGCEVWQERVRAELEQKSVLGQYTPLAAARATGSVSTGPTPSIQEYRREQEESPKKSGPTPSDGKHTKESKKRVRTERYRIT